MCYDERASLVSFVTGSMSSATLFYFNPALSVFFAWVTCMQLFDFIFWNNIEESTINYMTTKVALMFNVTQPIVLALCIGHYMRMRLKKESMALLIIYVNAMTLYLVYWWNDIRYTLVTPSTAPCLSWDWNIKDGCHIVYGLHLALLTLLFYQHFARPLNMYLAFVTFLTFVLSIPTYKMHNIGRFWCNYAGYIPLTLVSLSLWTIGS